MEGQNTYGFNDFGAEGWMMWCGAGRGVDANNADDFNVAAGDVDVTVSWITINDEGKAEDKPLLSKVTLTLAQTELPLIEEGTDEGDDNGNKKDSATFIKATSVALGAFDIMLA